MSTEELGKPQSKNIMTVSAVIVVRGTYSSIEKPTIYTPLVRRTLTGPLVKVLTDYDVPDSIISIELNSLREKLQLV